MNTVHVITGLKHGVGASTIAACLAIRLAETPGEVVVLIDSAPGSQGDLACLVGVPAHSSFVEFRPGAWLYNPRHVVPGEWEAWRRRHADADITFVVDGGVADNDESLSGPPDETVDVRREWVVVDNAYVTLHRWVVLDDDRRAAFDGVICVMDSQRSLNASDVEAVLDRPMSTVYRTDAVARATDAGLLASNIPTSMRFVSVILAVIQA